jgi:hypothetical protein
MDNMAGWHAVRISKKQGDELPRLGDDEHRLDVQSRFLNAEEASHHLLQ